jgi:hypothetical protein
MPAAAQTQGIGGPFRPGAPRPTCWLCHASTARLSAAACQRTKRTAYLLAVHKHVDDMCATTLGLCVRGGNAGDSAAWAHPGSGFYLGKRRPRPVHAEKTRIVHMPRRSR